ncbi:MAG: hypothetical protein GY850_25015 [bacterium]|nr:hypothetical protein [bacterium]
MHVESIGLQTDNINELIGVLKQGIPADSFDKLRKRLNVSDNLLSRIVQIPKRTLYAILKSPSTITREEHNFLINPAHPDFPAIEFGDPQRFEFDERLIDKYTRPH